MRAPGARAPGADQCPALHMYKNVKNRKVPTENFRGRSIVLAAGIGGLSDASRTNQAFLFIFWYL
jgi:hypothetical protein